MTESRRHVDSSTSACLREGCPRRKGRDGYCSLLCAEVDRRLAKTQALILEKGISPTTAELWAATVLLSDQLTEVDRLHTLIKSAGSGIAVDAGGRRSAL